MTPTQAVELFDRTLMTAFWLALPMLAVGFVCGVVLSVLQIITSIQDSAVSNLPRLAAFLFALLFLMPWMINRAMSFATGILGDLARYAH